MTKSLFAILFLFKFIRLGIDLCSQVYSFFGNREGLFQYFVHKSCKYPE